MYPSDNSPPNGRVPHESPDAIPDASAAASRDKAQRDRQVDALLASALSSPAPRAEFVASLGEQLADEFAMIHAGRRNGATTNITATNGTATNGVAVVAGHESSDDEGSAGNEQQQRAFNHEAYRQHHSPGHRSPGRRWWTAAAASLLIAGLFWSTQPSYSWAGMIAAIGQQRWTQSELLQAGVVRTRRWASAGWSTGAGGVAASSSGGELRYVDSQAGVALTRPPGGEAITRTPLPSQANDWQWLLPGLLSGDAGEWRFVEDSWRGGASHDGRDGLIELTVKFQAEDGSLAEVGFLIDPKTNLPLTARRVSPPSEALDAKVRFDFNDDGPRSIYDLGVDRDTPIVDRDTAVIAMRSSASSRIVLAPGAGDADKDELKTTADPFETSKNGATNSSTDSSAPSNAASSNAASSNAAAQKVINKSTGNEEQPAAEASAPAAPPEWKPVVETPLAAPLDDTELTSRVDALLRARWQASGVAPAARADDSELLRRLHLDLAGRIPTVGEARVFLEDGDANRVERLVDSLLASRDHATHFAAMWRKALIPRGDIERQNLPTESFEAWLADHVQRNTPHNELASDLLLAEGRIQQSGPLVFYAALKMNPEDLAAQTARTFLGMRLECAECHDHPFDAGISQEDFWAFAANFARISRPQGLMEATSPILRVHDTDHGEVTLPDSETIVAPSLPLTDRRVLDAPGWPSRREQMVTWLTSPHNDRFAKATVNRVWAHLFGRALVEPLDDIRDDSSQLVPGVLDELAADYARSGFDTRRLIRCLVMTEAYQLTSAATPSDEAAEPADRAPASTELFARMNLKPFTAEQLHDAIAVASKNATAGRGVAAGGLVRFGDTERDSFIRLFEAPNNQSIDYQAGIPQALTMMHGRLIHGATDVATSGMLRSLSAPFFTDQQRIETLFLATLSRKPTDTEMQTMSAHVAAASDRPGRQAKLGDVLWALLNSAEFTLNH